MSWATYKTSLTNAMTGYTEIPEGKDIEQMPDNKHKTYSLKWTGMGDFEMYTSNAIAYAHIVKLRVSYLNMESSTRHTNADLFITLCSTIAALTAFKGIVSDATFEDISGHPEQSIGEFEFYYGVDKLC